MEWTPDIASEGWGTFADQSFGLELDTAAGLKCEVDVETTRVWVAFGGFGAGIVSASGYSKCNRAVPKIGVRICLDNKSPGQSSYTNSTSCRPEDKISFKIENGKARVDATPLSVACVPFWLYRAHVYGRATSSNGTSYAKDSFTYSVVCGPT